MRALLLAVLTLVVASVAWAGPLYVPSCTLANIAQCGAASNVTTMMRITNSTTNAIGGTISGGGANEVLAWCEGTTCRVAADDSTFLIGQTGSTAFSGTTGASWTINSDSGGAETSTLDAGDADHMVYGSADVLDQSFDTVGSDFCLDCYNSNSASLENTTAGSVVFDMRDYADTTDDDMAHVAFAANCTTATTGAEDCDLTVNITEAGNVRTAALLDADGESKFPPEPADGGNGNVQHKINGIPKIAGFSLGTGNDGSETVNTDFGDSETPATDWTATANMTSGNDSGVFRKGTASLIVTVGATPSAGNGVDNALASGNQDWSADESFGLWMRCDTAHSAGDWVLEITDSVAGATTVNIPGQAVTDTWDWVEVDLSGVADASKDAITDLAIDLSTAGATTFAAGGICYFDYMWKWDAAEELAISQDIYEDGVLAMFSVITASASITPIVEVEGTDFFVHYESGNDFVVPITDLASDSLWGMAALE